MDSNQPRKTSTSFEYFLYAAILAETGLAALIYKVIFRNPELERLRIYFAIFYFAFLAWAIAQLNMLHRERHQPLTDSTPLESPVQESQPTELDIAPEFPDEERTRPVLGLTGAQFAIVVIVFAMAVATFSCALRLMN